MIAAARFEQREIPAEARAARSADDRLVNWFISWALDAKQVASPMTRNTASW